MPALNKQTLVNLLIDSPLREAIKINLIDIANNTNDADLPKIYSTITKELEIFQKASERRLKLAADTIAKLQGKEEVTSSAPSEPTTFEPATPEQPKVETPTSPSSTPTLSVPPLDLPPFPTKPTEETPEPTVAEIPTPPLAPLAPLTPPSELPPTPPISTPPITEIPTNPTPESPTPTSNSNINADEEALKEIQKELDNLKVSATEESAPPAPPTATP